MSYFKATSKNGVYAHKIKCDPENLAHALRHKWTVTRNKSYKATSPYGFSTPYRVDGAAPIYFSREISKLTPGRGRVYAKNGFKDMRKQSLTVKSADKVAKTKNFSKSNGAVNGATIEWATQKTYTVVVNEEGKRRELLVTTDLDAAQKKLANYMKRH